MKKHIMSPASNTSGHTPLSGRMEDYGILHEITEGEREAAIDLLRICNKACNRVELMQALTLFFQRLTGCEAVGVRLQQGKDFPYYETRGFPKEFVLAENSLCMQDVTGKSVCHGEGNPVLECMCGNVICRRFDPSKPFFTSRGSFWTNCTTELLAATTEADRRARTRNRCNGEGYESVALIPLRLQDETFGLFQFNDKRKGCFTPNRIALLEELVDSVAIALAKLKTDEALQESSQFTQQIINNVQEGVIVYGIDLRYQAWNPFMEQLTGLSSGEVLGKHPLEVFPFLSGAGVLESIQKALAGKQPDTIDFSYYIPRTNRSGWVSHTDSPLRNAKGEIIGVIGVVHDITDRKKAEQDILKREHNYRSLFENMSEGFAYCKMMFEDGQPQDFVYLDVNNAFELLTGLKDVLGKRVTEVIPGIKEAHPELFEICGRVAMACKPERFEIYLESLRACFSISAYSPEKGYFIAVFDNITERKVLELSLKEEKKFTENALNTLKDVFFVFDMEGRFLRWNKSVNMVSGYDDSEIVSMKPADFFRGENVGCIAAAIQKAARDGTAIVEAELTTKDGRQIPYEYTGCALKDMQGNILGITGVGRDISERKRAEAVLRESEERYRGVVENIGIGISVISPNMEILSLNKQMEQWFPDVHVSDRPTCYKAFNNPPKETVCSYCMTCLTLKDGQVHETVTETPSGDKIVHYRVVSSPIRDKEGKVIAAIEMVEDVSKQRQTEERINRQVQRLSALRSIDLAITSSGDMRVTLQIFVEHVITQLGADAANLLLLNPHTKSLEYASSQGFRSNALKHTYLRLGEGHAGLAALENRIVSIPNLKEDDNLFRRLGILKDEDFITYYGVPLVAKGKVKGVLEIFKRNLFEPDEEWFEFLDSLALQGAIAIDNNELFSELERSSMELSLAYDTTIEGWSHALDYRDKETEGHSRRVMEMTIRIAREMGISDEDLVHVRRGALLHDIGKMGIPDNILLKPGFLTDEEWKIMRLHPVYAYELLYPIVYLRPAIDIPYCHHEKWDGSGYPRGLKGEQIPLAARIFAAVDVWDALRSDRPYRPAWSREKTIEHIQQQAGIHFDPKVADTFLKMEWFTKHE